jgi:hypothetical protein
MGNYRYVGTHPVEVVKGDKVVPVGPGEFVELSAEEAKSEDNADVMENMLEVGGKK